MKKCTFISKFILALGLLAIPSVGFCSIGDLFSSKKEEKVSPTTQHKYKEIDGKELKSWIDSGKKFELIDARPKKYADGEVIIGAKFLAYDSDPKKIEKALPSKDAIIVTYCASEKCPASGYLSDTLVTLGYTNVYKYPGGLDDWENKHYPMGEAKKW